MWRNKDQKTDLSVGEIEPVKLANIEHTIAITGHEGEAWAAICGQCLDLVWSDIGMDVLYILTNYLQEPRGRQEYSLSSEPQCEPQITQGRISVRWKLWRYWPSLSTRFDHRRLMKASASLY